MNWCRSANQESVDQEIDNRRAQLNLCRRCSNYSDEAVRIANEAASYNFPWDFSAPKNRCGFEGPAWGTDRAAHFQWCMGANSEVVDAEAASRREWIGRCESCSSYAKGAVDQVRKYEYTCYANPPNDPRWSDWAQGHFVWCMGLKNEHYLEAADKTYQEEKARQSALDKCHAITEDQINRTLQGLTAQPTKVIGPKPKPPNITRKYKQGGQNSLSTANVATPDGLITKRKGSGGKKVVRRHSGPCVTADGRPCTTSSNNLLNPGLLENDGGFAAGGPSATGTPMSPGSLPGGIKIPKY
jgi:hypothetical protein